LLFGLVELCVYLLCVQVLTFELLGEQLLLSISHLKILPLEFRLELLDGASSLLLLGSFSQVRIGVEPNLVVNKLLNPRLNVLGGMFLEFREQIRDPVHVFDQDIVSSNNYFVVGSPRFLCVRVLTLKRREREILPELGLLGLSVLQRLALDILGRDVLLFLLCLCFEVVGLYPVYALGTSDSLVLKLQLGLGPLLPGLLLIEDLVRDPQ